MKKVIMVVLLLVGIACAGGGYYIFYYKPQQDALALEALEKEEQPVTPLPIVEEEEEIVIAAPVTDYYVSPPKLGVREFPDFDAFVESVVYRGDKLHILEKKDGWGRISPYYVYEEGGPEVAEWVPMEALLEVAPTISKQERVETVSQYIEDSDDFKQHFEMFIKTTDQLLQEGTCTPEDFEETKGWIRSVTFDDRNAYFVYCGGLKQANKIYLDVLTGKTFYR
ncbi:hypothetical protein L1D54_13850 [Vibrio brasiliensis]|jgi:hypothetical protein|uniref:SH3 domain protein n=2 Tax=Vibrio brasiliensis TaxID=170652 RepID=E8LUY6_9VIBR|nr:hypothetical protein [Vibrio brasiliensis]EGA65371.1 SH3 domain protein [Vibrio brasiliensis LMG 20546]MCG9648993.1 hypothetical protein [Vibrio brasiliensis]MCG9727681.1 hypothetical protein [Vibrio brasiliensis]MCG9751569.1 hypothetical protein [Vibrio brasiliensis]MCG9782865.1 hypothetical protein [Vibrio brasiliensis]